MSPCIPFTVNGMSGIMCVSNDPVRIRTRSGGYLFVGYHMMSPEIYHDRAGCREVNLCEATDEQWDAFEWWYKRGMKG